MLTKTEVKKQAFRIHASALLLGLGLLLSWAYYGTLGADRILADGTLKPGNPHVQFFVWLPSALGAYGLGSWTVRMTLLKGKDVDTIPGAIVVGLATLGVAMVVGQVLG